MISFNILSKRFSLKRKELSDTGIGSITKKDMVLVQQNKIA